MPGVPRSVVTCKFLLKVPCVFDVIKDIGESTVCDVA